MKGIIACCLLALLSAAIGAPAVLPAAADNVTSANVTLFSTDLASLSAAMEGMEASMDEVTTQMEDYNTAAEEQNVILDAFTGRFFELLLVIFFVVLAFWVKHPWWRFILDILAGFLLIFTAVRWIDSYTAAGIILIFFSICFFGSALMFAVSEGGPSRGWSEIRGWFRRRGE